MENTFKDAINICLDDGFIVVKDINGSFGVDFFRHLNEKSESGFLSMSCMSILEDRIYKNEFGEINTIEEFYKKVPNSKDIICNEIKEYVIELTLDISGDPVDYASSMFILTGMKEHLHEKYANTFDKCIDELTDTPTMERMKKEYEEWLENGGYEGEVER